MKYIIVIILIISLLIIMLSCFSNKHVNKEEFQDDICSRQSTFSCTSTPGCELRSFPNDETNYFCIRKDEETPCDKYYDTAVDQCPSDRCYIKVEGTGTRECKEKPPVLIKSGCYGKNQSDCANDDKCNTHRIYDNDTCLHKQDKQCSALSFDECEQKSGNTRQNPGCRLRIKDVDNAMSSKCNGKAEAECNNEEGCVFKLGEGCIDYKGVLFDNCNDFNNGNDEVCRSLSDERDDELVLCNYDSTADTTCSNKDDIGAEIRQNKNERIRYLLNQHCESEKISRGYCPFPCQTDWGDTGTKCGFFPLPGEEDPVNYCFEAKQSDTSNNFYVEKCFPYSPRTRSNFSFGIDASNVDLLNLPINFFENEETTIITLKQLKCEDINGLYQKAKEVNNLTQEPASGGAAMPPDLFFQKEAARNIMTVVESGEISSFTDDSKKCKIVDGAGECYNFCEGEIHSIDCDNKGDQGQNGECQMLGNPNECKRSQCLQHSDETNCNASPNCEYTTPVLADKCVPDTKCGDGEQLKILPTDSTTSENEFTCEPCEPGYYEESNICLPCPTNQFSGEGATSCTPKATCNVETHYISSPVKMDLPNSLKDKEYDLKMKSNFMLDKFGATKDRTCLELNKCEKSNDKFLVDKKVGINTGKAKNLFNEYQNKYNFSRYQQQPCNYFSEQDCPSDVCQLDGGQCKELELPLRRYNDYTCGDLTSCTGNTYISNYQEMLDREFDSMFIDNRKCDDSTNCVPGEHESGGRVTTDNPIVTDLLGNEMYTQDRSCATCQIHTYSDEPNMTQCVPQPTLGLGMGAINYDPTSFESKKDALNYEVCDEINNFQDTLPPHREPCKTKMVCATGQFPIYKQYENINCGMDNLLRDNHCDVEDCGLMKDFHTVELASSIN